MESAAAAVPDHSQVSAPTAAVASSRRPIPKLACFDFTSGGAPLLQVDPSTAGPPLLNPKAKKRADGSKAKNKSVNSTIMDADLSHLTRDLWGVPEAFRELTQNLTDAVLRAAYPAPTTVEWTTEATDHGARFLLNGAYGGEWAVVHDPTYRGKKGGTGIVSALFYNRGAA